MRSIITLAACFASALSLGPRPASGQTIRLNLPSVSAAAVRPNLLTNPSFEDAGSNRVPIGWSWDRRNTDATCTLDRTTPHGGRQALKITNGTPYGAHVYGLLRAERSVQLQSGTPCTLSIYVRSEHPGHAWIGGGSNWQHRLRLPATGGRWQRAWMTFTPTDADRDFVLLVGTDSPTSGLWLDDLKLEAGDSPSPAATPAGVPSIEPVVAEKAIDGDGAFELSFELLVPRKLSSAVLRVSLDRPKVQAELTTDLEPGAWMVRVPGEASAADDAPHVVTLALLDGEKELASAQTQVRFYSASNATRRLETLTPKITAAAGTLETIRAQGQDVAYPLATLTVLENFAAYAREDVEHGEIRRALMQIADLEALATRLDRELKAAATGRHRLPEVPRWTGAQRPRIDGPAFIAPVTYPAHPGKTVERPVFFYGYGHFSRAQADIEKFPRYGTNIIQCEVGPSRVLPAEDQVSAAPMQEVHKLLDRGQKAGVAICLLISPHYFPDWALAKYPHLRKRREGFLQYCLHAPEGQALLQRFIAELIPPIKDHPALHSICLSNEPVNAEEPCEFARAEFHQWLQARHGDIATLNARWGTQLTKFEDAPLPDPFNREGTPPGCWYDFVRFNQEWFAGWHRMLADAIHAVAPELPVHAKGMTWTMTGSSEVRFGVDAELFGGFSQINGNDSVNFYNPDPGEFAQGWLGQMAAYDLQRAVKDAPSFNTENHVIVDRETRYVPPEHIRAALWQEAVHGQSATTIWVWERTYDPRSDIAGSIMHRPACAEAVGRTTLDLNRLAEEVTAIQRLQPQVAILHSVSGLAWDTGRYDDCAGKLYTALSFTGLKIGFVTERQLESGQAPAVPLLFVPNLAHLSEAAFQNLRKYPGRLVVLGDDSVLSRDEYDHERKARPRGQRMVFQYGRTTWPMLHRALTPILVAAKLQPLVTVSDEHGKPATGVTWLCAPTDAGALVTLCNLGHDPARIMLRKDGRPVTGQNLLSDEATPEVITAASLEPQLIRVSTGAKD